MLKQIALAFAFMLVGGHVALAQRAPTVTAEEQRSFVDFIQRLQAALDHAGAASRALGSLAEAQEGDHEAFLRSLPGVRQAIAGGRVSLAQAGAELDALPSPDTGGNAEIRNFEQVLLADSRTYITNIAQLLDSMDQMVVAIQRNDAAEIRRLAPVLSRSLSVMLDGQRTILRGRQHLVPAGSSQYYAIGVLLSVYDGMGAFMPGAPDSEAALNAALATAIQNGQLGRAALARERAAAARLSEPMRSQALNILIGNERAFAINDQTIAVMQQAAAAPKANVDQYLAQFTDLESQFLALTRQDINSMSSQPTSQ